MNISRKRFRKIRHTKNQTRKKYKSLKRKGRRRKRSFRRKKYLNLSRQTLKLSGGGGKTS